ncbi:hypothetical protein VTJ49DRAFT_4080 [Mycothermus thermophilus]|uniref:Glycoside hydrolase 131 catalytic N-terminal domain-containing protein n=1 Tax=Humicola insolens TaxID=85995 RepID=A0ABR3V754_HUMIN
MQQRGFRRAGLQFQGDTNNGSPGSRGVKTLHFSLRWDNQRPLNLSHEYLLTWHETAAYDANQFNFEAGQIIGQSNLPRDTYKVLDRNNRQVWSTPILKDAWQNFAIRLDFDRNTLQVFYSQGNEPLQSVTNAVYNNNAGEGQYQIGILKKPTGTSDVLSEQPTVTMARIQIPIDVLTSRLNFGERLNSIRSGSLASRFSNMRPLSEFLDVKRVNKPANFGEMQSRVNYNLGHFSSNYAVVFTMLCLYALLTNFWLLFDIIFVVTGMFIIGKLEGRDLEFGQQRFSTVQLYTGLWVIAIPIALISGVFGTMMWLIGASGVVILGHAALLDKPIDEAFSGEAV